MGAKRGLMMRHGLEIVSKDQRDGGLPT